MGIYYDEADSVLQAAGVACLENSINAGWQSRARSSGGFPSAPKGIVWHHTASQTSVESDLAWMIDNCPDEPVGNMLIDRDGNVWLIAAGASNCAGKGGPAQFSRGTVALDSGNTGCWNIEVANNGIGEVWPAAQMRAYFLASNALNAHFGNQPTDVITHNGWAPDRKIDPATAAAVQGDWSPHSINSSGTWNLDDIKNQCLATAGLPPVPVPVPPEPVPQPPSEDWMANLPSIKKGDSGPAVKRMQHLLAAAGYMNEANVSNYDGVWGNGTENAKIKFDNEHGLTPSPPSDCGDKSWKALNGA